MQGADGDGSADKVTSAATYYKLVHDVEEKVTEQPALLSGGALKDYQIAGLQWMVSLYNNNLNGILADEMGLGKTIQTVALFCYLMEKKTNPGPYMVVLPLTTLSNWRNEFAQWAPSLTVVSYYGTQAERNDLYTTYVKPKKFNVLLTTYEYIIHKIERGRLSAIKWQYVVVDEGHRLKNHNSRLSLELSTRYDVSLYDMSLHGVSH